MTNTTTPQRAVVLAIWTSFLAAACGGSHTTDASEAGKQFDGGRTADAAGKRDADPVADSGARVDETGVLDSNRGPSVAAMKSRCETGWTEEEGHCVRWRLVAPLPETCRSGGIGLKHGGDSQIDAWIHGHGSIAVRCDGQAYDYRNSDDSWHPVPPGWGEVYDAHNPLPGGDSLWRVQPVGLGVESVVLTTSVYAVNWWADRYLRTENRWIDTIDPPWVVQPVIAVPHATGPLFASCRDGTGLRRSAIYERVPIAAKP